MSTSIKTDWATLKALGWTLRYLHQNGNYYIYGNSNLIEYSVVIPEGGSDATDFVNNYQATATDIAIQPITTILLDKIVLAGGTDATKIGNTGDRLKVDASFATLPTVAANVVPARQLSAQAGKSFTVTSGLVAILLNTETNLFLIKNANGSGITVKLQQLKFYTDAQLAFDCYFKAYLDPTITGNGTALTPVGARQTSQNAAVATTYKSPVTSARGTLLDAYSAGSATSLVEVYDRGFWLEPNHSLLISAVFAGVQNVGVTLTYVEE